jgi:hypothetical protein
MIKLEYELDIRNATKRISKIEKKEAEAVYETDLGATMGAIPTPTLCCCC